MIKIKFRYTKQEVKAGYRLNFNTIHLLIFPGALILSLVIPILFKLVTYTFFPYVLFVIIRYIHTGTKEYKTNSLYKTDMYICINSNGINICNNNWESIKTIKWESVDNLKWNKKIFTLRYENNKNLFIIPLKYLTENDKNELQEFMTAYMKTSLKQNMKE